MNDNRTGGMMLVAGSVAGLITMALHPVAPHGAQSPHQIEMLVLLNRTVHGLAIAALPVLFLGALALTRRLSPFAVGMPWAALVVYGFASVAVMVAGALSGFVGSDLIYRMTAEPATAESTRLLMSYTFRLNQAFSSVYVVGVCTAVMLWSLTMLRSRRFSTGLGVYGLVLGPLILAVLFTGNLPLNVHGFGLVVLAQAIWFIVAGVLLMRHRDDERSAPADSQAWPA